MVDVTIRFVPPDDPDQAALRVYEGSSALGPFIQIDRTTEVGTYLDYITYYTTTQAQDKNDWFSIAWEDGSGGVGAMSAPVKGGTKTEVAEITERVQQRDSRLDEDIVRQEAEGAIEQFSGGDPYSSSLVLTYRQKNGLVYLVMARAYMAMIASQSRVEQATIGQVTFKTQAGAFQNVDIEKLIDLANAALMINTSVILQMKDVYHRHPDWHQFFVDWEQLPWIVGIPHGTFGS